MGAIAVSSYSAQQIALIRRTVAKDCDDVEFDQFVHICKAVRLDPLRRQIYAFVFSKDDSAKRQMTVVTAIGGYRSIAARTGNYRPDDQPARVTYNADLISPANPLGIVKCEVAVYQYLHGQWFPAIGEAFWDEYAPIIKSGDAGEQWVKTGQKYPPGHAKAGKDKYRKELLGEVVERLDPMKGGWTKMPHIMIAKCAEANALRKAWPDDFAGIEVEEEIDRRMVDITPSQAANEADAERKLALVGGKDALTVDWTSGTSAGKLERVPIGRFADAVLQWGRNPDITATELRIWWHRNEAARSEFKAKHGSDYLELQKAYEALTHERERQDQEAESAA